MSRKRKLSGIPFVDRFRARRAIKGAGKAVKKVEHAIKDARHAIDAAKEKADVTDRVSITSAANAVEQHLETTLCPVRSSGGGSDPCDDAKADCRKKVGANLKGPVSKKFRGAWEGCVTAAGCDPND